MPRTSNVLTSKQKLRNILRSLAMITGLALFLLLQFRGADWLGASVAALSVTGFLLFLCPRKPGTGPANDPSLVVEDQKMTAGVARAHFASIGSTGA